MSAYSRPTPDSFKIRPVQFENRTQKMFERLQSTIFTPASVQAPPVQMPESAKMAQLEARIREKQAQQEREQKIASDIRKQQEAEKQLRQVEQ